MSNNDIDRIRQKIRLQQYDMSAHAMEEMVVGRLATSGRYLIITVYEITKLEG